jgi:ribose 5-phosphate isomerase A
MGSETAKRAAGEAAAALVEPGMRVGLGTGSTAHWCTLALGRRVAEGLRITAVATSAATAHLAGGQGIPLGELGRGGVDLDIDGADCVDADLRLIKGAGGALLREKVVAAAAARFVVVVDASKLHESLAGPVPVEVLEFGWEHTLHLLELTGGRYALRRDAAGQPLRSDNGNLIADGDYAQIDDPEGLATRLDAVPGLIGHGLFLGMADQVLVGHGSGVVDSISLRGGRP